MLQRNFSIDQARPRRIPQQFISGIVDAWISEGDAAVDFGAGDRLDVFGEQQVLQH